jgi:hypothetical protein
MKGSSHTIRNRNRDLPVCNAVPRPIRQGVSSSEAVRVDYNECIFLLVLVTKEGKRLRRILYSSRCLTPSAVSFIVFQIRQFYRNYLSAKCVS